MSAIQSDFYKLRDPIVGKARVKKLLSKKERNMEQYLAPWIGFSKEAKHVYPSQGLLTTPHDYIDYSSYQMLPQEKIVQTLRVRTFFLLMANHPYRRIYLKKVNARKFMPPGELKCNAIDKMIRDGISFSVGDLGASVVGSQKRRVSRKERYAQGPFVKLGKQARSLFVGSASPDVWNSAAAISTMAASNCLACIPRNGLTSDIARQVDLASECFEWLGQIEKEILTGRKDRKEVLAYWKRNVCAALTANPENALKQAVMLNKVGISSFRIYSPEPGTGTVDTVKALRKKFGDKVEIFAGQIIDVKQAIQAQAAGADGIFVGIGGGGRCITGVRSGTVVDWPSLVWQLRGKLRIPIIAEGGASDHIAVSLLLGASAISVSRIVAGGTIESPGGALYCSDNRGRLYKPYGGEASARTKYLDGKLMPFNIPAFVEGETTKAKMSYVKFTQPTLTYNLHLLHEDAILSLVFRNVDNIADMQNIAPSPLMRATNEGNFQRNTH